MNDIEIIKYNSLNGMYQVRILSTNTITFMSKEVYQEVKSKTIRSKPERIVDSFLRTNNISFICEKELNNSKKRFDFYIEAGILDLKPVAIEVNGNSHYNQGYGSKREGVYKRTRQSDDYKVEYCKNNNIKLIFIDARKSTYDYVIHSLKKCSLFSNAQYNFSKEEIRKNLM